MPVPRKRTGRSGEVAALLGLSLFLAASTAVFRETAFGSSPQGGFDPGGSAAPMPGDPWNASQMIEPEQLAKALSLPQRQRPVVLYVGPLVFYRSGHIPDAKRIGPAAQPAGMQLLKKELEGIPRDKEIFLYCGCCPWEDCPNIRPAFAAAQEMGFSKVKVLHIARNFKLDWLDKGLPTQRGD